MAKTTAPLLGFGASGQIGSTQVYASWRGVSYARRYVVPANPNSAGQQLTRGTFKWLNGVWKLLTADAQAPWTLFASGKALTNRNAYIKSNLSVLRSDTDVTEIVGSPGAAGGPAYGSVTAAASSGTVTVTLAAPTLPTDWAITGATAIAVPVADPATATNYVTYAASAVASPWHPAIADVPNGDYIVTAFYKYSKPDGTTAYSPSANVAVTAS